MTEKVKEQEFKRKGMILAIVYPHMACTKSGAHNESERCKNYALLTDIIIISLKSLLLTKTAWAALHH